MLAVAASGRKIGYQYVNFYEGGTDHLSQNSLDAILMFNDDELEMNRGYMQWLFPLKENTDARTDVPTCTEAEFRVFRSRPALLQNVFEATRMMGRFYGCTITGTYDDPSITPAADLTVRYKERYLTKGFAHNYLRITRILRCLGECGLFRMKHLLLKFFMDEITLPTGGLYGLTDHHPMVLQSMAKYWIPTLGYTPPNYQAAMDAIRSRGTHRRRSKYGF